MRRSRNHSGGDGSGAEKGRSPSTPCIPAATVRRVLSGPPASTKSWEWTGSQSSQCPASSPIALCPLPLPLFSRLSPRELLSL